MTKSKYTTIRVVVFLSMVLMCFKSAHALDQKFTVSEERGVIATISSKELSRIVFDAKIIRVFGISGEFHQEILDNSLYIKPHALKPINFFVLLDSGETYKIIAVVEDIPATQITINSVDRESVLPGSREAVLKKPLHGSSTLTGEAILKQDVRRIVRSIIADEVLDYKVQRFNKSCRPKDGIRRNLESVWSKPGIEASKYYLTNVSSAPITINQEDYLDGATAIYINETKLAPGQTAILIQIRA